MRDKITIVDCFEEQVEKSGNELAVKSKKNILTYSELNNLANLIADYILKNDLGMYKSDGQNVAMLFEHDSDMIAGIMGILKAGRSFVALDPTYPPGRLSNILGDSKAGILITNNKNLNFAHELIRQTDYPVNIFNLDSIDKERIVPNPGININPEQAAYIIYTSGSTGKPKGVIQSHKNALHFIKYFNDRLKINSSDRLALITTYSHAMAVIDIFCILSQGAILYPYDIKSEGNMGRLAGWIREEEITIYHSVPTIYRYFIETITDREQVSTVKIIIAGGEPLYRNDIDLYKKYFGDQCVFVNLFGASELIIAAVNIVTKQTEIISASVPVGCFADGVNVSVLDESGKQAGPGSEGELIYSSRYLSPGYWNMEEYTRQVFQRSASDMEELIYRSGDLGKVLSDGSIEYLGRKDFQVKISGNRVETGEIEAALLSHPLIKEAAVTAKKNAGGDSYLCAFFVSDGDLSTDALREYLGKELPDYMVPSYFIRLQKMPLMENGKLNRKDLQKINIDIGKTNDCEPPANEIESILAGVWEKILDVEQVGVNTSFYDLGGNSILAIKFEVEMEKRGLKLNSDDVYRLKTIRQLAIFLKDGTRETADSGVSGSIEEKVIQEIPDPVGESIGTNAAIKERKILEGIEPFNDVYFKNCYFNALIPIGQYFGRDILPFIINDIASYRYKSMEDSDIMDYISMKPLQGILNELGLGSVTDAQSSDIIGDIKTAVSAGRPVVLWIDCYYSPVRADMYLKDHWAHCMVVYGYDDEQQVCSIIEHRHKDNLSYEKKVMKYRDVLNCCKGYLDKYYMKSMEYPVYQEFYSTGQGNLHDYIFRFASNMLAKQEEVSEGIKTIIAYKKDFERIACSPDLLEANVESMLTSVNNVINIKNVQKYSILKLFGANFRLIENINEILEKWEYIRKVLAKYMYSSVYKEESLNCAASFITQIHDSEAMYNEELYKFLNYWKT